MSYDVWSPVHELASVGLGSSRGQCSRDGHSTASNTGQSGVVGTSTSRTFVDFI